MQCTYLYTAMYGEHLNHMQLSFNKKKNFNLSAQFPYTWPFKISGQCRENWLGYFSHENTQFFSLSLLCSFEEFIWNECFVILTIFQLSNDCTFLLFFFSFLDFRLITESLIIFYVFWIKPNQTKRFHVLEHTCRVKSFVLVVIVI